MEDCFKFLIVPAKNSMWEEEIANMNIIHYHLACKINILPLFFDRSNMPNILFHLVHSSLAMNLGGEI